MKDTGLQPIFLSYLGVRLLIATLIPAISLTSVTVALMTVP